MCYHGHQLPELFLLDEQKCATTSLSTDLHDKWGVIHGAEKEPHYFDHNGHDLSTFAKLFPPCGPHVVTFDGTPKYVLDGVNARSHHSLQFLKSTYGVARLKKTTFAMILCDPAQRAQSFTYHLGMYDRRWGSIGDTDFKAKASHPDLSYFFAFRNGLYAEIIDHVLQELGQLTIIPAPIYYTHPELAIKELIEVIRERSGKTPPSTSHGHDIAHHGNIHPHPPIMEDTRPQDRPRIREYYANTVDRVYALMNGADARVTFAPPLERWPAEVPQHFLETSPIMSARLRPLPSGTSPSPPSKPPHLPHPPMSQCGSWPRVYILGVQKGATTSLAVAFKYTDGVGVSGQGGCCESGYCVYPPGEESHYFDQLRCTRDDGDHACSKYPLIFPTDKINVDSTPEYLSCPTVPGDLHMVMPASMRGNVRFIMIFREQSSRLLSIYNHKRVDVATADYQPESHPWFSHFCDGDALINITDGHFEPSFHNYATCLMRRWRLNEDNRRDWYSRDKGTCNWREADLARGLYLQALEKWRAVWPRQQILVIPFHQLASHEGGRIMDSSAAFTGVPSLPRSLPVENAHPSSWKVDAMCCATRCELLQFHEEEAENLRLYRQLANDRGTRLAPSQELPFSPFPQPDCVECPHISSTHCVPNAYYAAAEFASAWHFDFHFDTFVVDHPKTVVLCLVLLVLLVFRIARRTLRNLGGGFAMNPKRYFEEMQCSDEMNIEKFWNGDPSSSVAAGEGLPTSSVAAGEGGGGGREVEQWQGPGLGAGGGLQGLGLGFSI